jgi:putative hydrolase of the HAD superfamily
MYRHLFFDLDHTLWDFERNSQEALTEIFVEYQISQWGDDITLDYFLETFQSINSQLWHQYNHNHIDQQTLRFSRFKLIFENMKVANVPISTDLISEIYLQKTPQKPHLLPHAREVLEYLAPKYPLHIITNGFPEIQDMKLRSSGIEGFFELIVTSENAGCKKPDKKIFEYAMSVLDISPQDCLMIGDNLEADIIGARNAAIDQVYYNPCQLSHEEDITFEIDCLSSLYEIL